ncbi:hypothetical protein N0B44_28720 [Roseibacterium beibuensis]|nr:hypothetical protein [Roseibacterium beibuensis]
MYLDHEGDQRLCLLSLSIDPLALATGLENRDAVTRFAKGLYRNPTGIIERAMQAAANGRKGYRLVTREKIRGRTLAGSFDCPSPMLVSEARDRRTLPDAQEPGPEEGKTSFFDPDIRKAILKIDESRSIRKPRYESEEERAEKERDMMERMHIETGPASAMILRDLFGYESGFRVLGDMMPDEEPEHPAF